MILFFKYVVLEMDFVIIPFFFYFFYFFSFLFRRVNAPYSIFRAISVAPVV